MLAWQSVIRHQIDQKRATRRVIASEPVTLAASSTKTSCTMVPPVPSGANAR